MTPPTGRQVAPAMPLARSTVKLATVAPSVAQGIDGVDDVGVDNAELSSDAKDLGDAWCLDVTQCQGVGHARLAAEEDEDSARYRAARLARAKAGRLKVDSGARVARTGPPYPTQSRRTVWSLEEAVAYARLANDPGGAAMSPPVACSNDETPNARGLSGDAVSPTGLQTMPSLLAIAAVMTSVCILVAVLYRAMSIAPPVTPPSPPPSLPGAKQVLIEFELITVTS